ncbi:MAG: hypothetical protein C5B52_06400 [Bacteroidetes bacterium]|nr:MAG: hypothetical protein C5B52_06400 [Bacteroidota bacterium]
MLKILSQPWPWYISGPLIGLMVPALLVLGNRNFGISSNLRHICAACFPGKIPFFKYDWKNESWNLYLAAGIIIGALLVRLFFWNDQPIVLNPKLTAELSAYGLKDFNGLVPKEIFSWNAVLSVRSLIMLAGGGFLVGFGTRYAGGCTSGHAITGLANLQLPSLIATMSFFIGGIIMANFILPIILRF